MSVNVLILRAAGTNCDKETSFAFEKVGAKTELVHVNRLRENPSLMKNYQVMVLPGGFSYGDDISAGKIMAVRLRHELGDQLGEFIQSDKLILGICNGFQILVKTGLLPDPELKGEFSQKATLSDNDSGKFEDRWVYLKSESKKCVFMSAGKIIELPIAHGEGKFAVKNESVLNELKANDQIVFRYVDSSGNPGGFPINPNGSLEDIAGICDKSGRILGLMPHPERHIEKTQHPNWTGSEKGIPPHGLEIFKRAVKYFA